MNSLRAALLRRTWGFWWMLKWVQRGHKDDLVTGVSLIPGEAETAEVVQAGGEKALGSLPYSNLPGCKRGF